MTVAGAPLQPHARRTVRWLSLLCVLLVTHGSLYPWRFAMPASFDAEWARMMNQSSWWTGVGDVVGNVVLFVPVGVLGWALAREWRAPGPVRAATIGVCGVAFAFALQVAQLFVPARDAAWSDVVWNTLGLMLGLWAAVPVLRMPLGALRAAHWRVPLVFSVLWLLLQWWPFVPRLDWQHMKDALKPLLLHPQWRTGAALDAALGVVVLGALVHPLRHRSSVLIGLPALAALGTLIVSHQVLTLPHSVGWIVGLGAALWLARMPARTVAWIGAALAWLWFSIDELKPFQLADALGTFEWLPFAALLRGSMSANTLALAWQMFWLGAVMLLAHAHGVRAGPLTVALGLWALLLEAAQMLLPGRTADVTPALLPWLWCLLMPWLRPSRDAFSERGR